VAPQPRRVVVASDATEERGVQATSDSAGKERSERAVDAALARVLEADRTAQRALAAAREEGGRIAERARAQARRVAERARERIAGAQARVQAALQAELDALEAQARALPGHAEPDAAALARLERALHALAATLTGGAGVAGDGARR